MLNKGATITRAQGDAIASVLIEMIERLKFVTGNEADGEIEAELNRLCARARELGCTDDEEQHACELGGSACENYGDWIRDFVGQRSR